MSAEERAQAEIEFTSSNPRYAANPEALNTRMELWDMGFKNEPRCLTNRADGPDDYESCECIKTPSGASTVVCMTNEGYKCILSAPVVGFNGWTQADADEKGIGDCAENFPQRIPRTAVGAAAIVNGSGEGGKLIVIITAFLLLLGVWGHLR